MTAVELDRAVAALRAIGGCYEMVAAVVERDNRGVVTS